MFHVPLIWFCVVNASNTCYPYSKHPMPRLHARTAQKGPFQRGPFWRQRTTASAGQPPDQQRSQEERLQIQIKRLDQLCSTLNIIRHLDQETSHTRTTNRKNTKICKENKLHELLGILGERTTTTPLIFAFDEHRKTGGLQTAPPPSIHARRGVRTPGPGIQLTSYSSLLPAVHHQRQQHLRPQRQRRLRQGQQVRGREGGQLHPVGRLHVHRQQLEGPFQTGPHGKA